MWERMTVYNDMKKIKKVKSIDSQSYDFFQ